MTYIATYVDIQPNHTAQAIPSLTQYAKSGSIEIFQEAFRQNRFVIIETWQDDAAFQEHESDGRTTQYRTDLKAIHNSPNDQRVHQSFSVGSGGSESNAGTLVVITHVDVPPPRREETEILLRRLAEQSRMDAGAVRYDVYQQNAPRTNHFTVFAVWKDERAFASHELQSHTREFRESLGPMLGAPYDERFYRRVEWRSGERE
jgi:quinol monooxygenase YgiN